MTRSTAAVLAAWLIAITPACADRGADDDTAAQTPDTMVARPATSEVATGEFVDPNNATREQLLAVPLMNDSLADALIAGRPYNDMVGVDRVLATRLSEADRDSIYTRIWQPLDLNSASAEEILLIPGVGPRLQHEFEEYRPYADIAQFRREMGKYVDDIEVARLERYVMIRS